MSITATTGYISNTELLAWMEQKTDGLYDHMRSSMDIANERAGAEDALSDVSAKILAAQSNGGNATALHDAVNTALQKYGDIPEVVALLRPMADKMNADYDTNAKAAAQANVLLPALRTQLSNATSAAEQSGIAAMINAQTAKANWTLKLSDTDLSNFTQDIKGKLDALSKQDQLGMVDIQELNSEINQTKQTASALMDSSSKTTSDVISHIC